MRLQYLVLWGLLFLPLLSLSSVTTEGSWPRGCILETGLYCQDYKWRYETREAGLVIENGMGRDITIKSVSVVQRTEGPQKLECDAIVSATQDLLVKNGEQVLLNFSCKNWEAIADGYEDAFDIKIEYLFENVTLSNEGELWLEGPDRPQSPLKEFLSSLGILPIYFLLYVGLLILIYLKRRYTKIPLADKEVAHADWEFIKPTSPKAFLFFLTLGIWFYDNFLNLTMVGDVIMPVPQADFILLDPLVSFLAKAKLSFLIRSGRGLLPLVPLQLLYWYLAICFGIFAWKAVSMHRFRLVIRSKLCLSVLAIILVSLVSTGGDALYLSLAFNSSTKEAVRTCQENFSGFYEDECIGEVIGAVAESDPNLALKMIRHYGIYVGPTLVKVVEIYAQEDIDRAYGLCRQHAIHFLDLWKCLTHVVTSGKREDIPRIIEICKEYDELVPWSYRKGECMEIAYKHYQERNNITNLKEFCIAAGTTFEKGLCGQKEIAGSIAHSGDIIQLSMENVTAALSLCENTRPQFPPCWNLLQYTPEELDEEKLYEIYRSLGEWEALVFIEKKARMLDSNNHERWDICINARTLPQLHACSYPQIHWFLIRDDIVIERFERDPVSTQKLCQNSRQKPPCGTRCPQWKELYSYPLCDYLVNLTQSELEETHSLYVKTGEFPIEISDGLYGDTKRANNPKSEKDCEIDNNPELVGTCFMNLALSTGVLKYCRKAIYNASACAIELDADKTTPIEELDILCHDLADLETGRWLEVSWSCYKDIAIHRQEVSLCQKAERYAGECAISVDTDKSLPLEELEAVCEAVSWTPEFKRRCYEDIAVHRQ